METKALAQEVKVMEMIHMVVSMEVEIQIVTSKLWQERLKPNVKLTLVLEMDSIKECKVKVLTLMMTSLMMGKIVSQLMKKKYSFQEYLTLCRKTKLLGK